VSSLTDLTQLTSGQSLREQANPQKRSKVTKSKLIITSPKIFKFAADKLFLGPLKIHVHNKGQSP
jgi:hypothetical protein